MRVLVTGADGFIGRNLCKVLIKRGYTVRAAVRTAKESGCRDIFQVGSIDSTTVWNEVVDKVEVVIHLANRAHVTHEAAGDALVEFRKTNVDGTLRLASCAVAAGVRRFIFLSSIGVNGISTEAAPFTETNPPAPTEPYAVSKLEAEQGLSLLAERSKMELVIVRPPLVYGPGVRGNLLRLLKLVDSGIPLPLGSIKNSRSFIGIENLSNLLEICLHHPNATGRLFLAADGRDISTPELIRVIANALGRNRSVFAFPVPLLKVIARLAGKNAEFERMIGSLRVDATLAKSILDWKPVPDLEEGIRSMVESYRVSQSKSQGTGSVS